MTVSDENDVRELRGRLIRIPAGVTVYDPKPSVLTRPREVRLHDVYTYDDGTMPEVIFLYRVGTFASAPLADVELLPEHEAPDEGLSL